MSANDQFLRPAIETDACCMSAIHIAAIKALPATLYSEEELLAWRNYLDQPDGANILRSMKLKNCWVAVDKNVIVGFTSYIFDELIALYVHPKHQGQGVGRALVNHFCETASKQGIEKVITTASLYAEGFYRRLGFKFIEKAPHYLKRGMIVPVSKMSKNLLPATK